MRPNFDSPSRVPPWWHDLFCPDEAETGVVRLRTAVLRRGGRPFLVLPAEPALAAAALELYPGQRRRARLLKCALGLLFRARVAGVVFREEVPFDPAAPLSQLLAGATGAPLPRFAVLAGNAATEGARFIVLAWRADGTPAAVVKAGVTEAAKRLIAREREFLLRHGGTRAGIPSLLPVPSQLDGPDMLLLPYFAGQMPRGMEPSVAALLRGWMDPARRLAVQETDLWRRLRLACADVPGWGRVAAVLEAQPVAATVMHGDFAPWNLRVTPDGSRAWALDWERGEFPGMPGWDWLHHEIQCAVLVRREEPEALRRTAARLLAAEEFRRLAELGGFAGREREMLAAYLLHLVHVLRPTEGMEANRLLLNALMEQIDSARG